jgi:hypothetical protein
VAKVQPWQMISLAIPPHRLFIDFEAPSKRILTGQVCNFGLPAPDQFSNAWPVIRGAMRS